MAQPSAHARFTDSRLANVGAQAIRDSYDNYRTRFSAVTARARSRFESRDWRGAQADTTDRLRLYRESLDPLVEQIRSLLREKVYDKLIWASMKAVYSGWIESRGDWELAETYFNSVTRRIFTTVGVDHQIEFVDTDYETPPSYSSQPVYHTYDRPDSNVQLIGRILEEFRFETPYVDLRRDAEEACEALEIHLHNLGALRVVERAEIVKSVFYRAKGAYLVGRLFSGSHMVPFVMALLNTPEGVIVDALLLSETDLSILFSFAHSYFHVEVERPYDLVRFLSSLIPRKRIAELYISIGFNKHGKTVLYRDLLHHLAYSDNNFEVTRGARGMVMIVFTMPSFPLVFKVIRDRFAQPKETTRRAVMGKYRLVFQHDRAGRLADAQEFEHLQFDRRRFSEELLDELQREASHTVSVDADHVIIQHAYVERRMIPLDIYVREASTSAAEAAVIDYGRAIRDLAASNIFPGDLLLKNFGVSRHGRVIFYDYDELCLVTDCHFRKMPKARRLEDEMSAEPWFSVHENDIFPEEFPTFLGLSGSVREAFMKHHAELFEMGFWRDIQNRLKEGELISVFPYGRANRLPHRDRRHKEGLAS